MLVKNWARVQNKHQAVQIPCTLKRATCIYISIHQCLRFKFKHWNYTRLLSCLSRVTYIKEWIKHCPSMESGSLLEPNVIEDIFCLEKIYLIKHWCLLFFPFYCPVPLGLVGFLEASELNIPSNSRAMITLLADSLSASPR